jgi:hypothetical protein
MPTLHALLVAINDYPDGVNSLRGCINDMQEFHGFLDEFCQQSKWTFRPRVLTDLEATRANIISGFDHFQEAADGDSCVFYFSGHGSRLKAPEKLAEVKPGGVVESLVCQDSLPDGKDLVDKELSYLLWKAGMDRNGKNKNIHFLVVTDCCHSGSATRGAPKPLPTDVIVRQILPGSDEPDRITHSFEEFLGVEEYKILENGKYAPPRGRYVHLGACQREETAKEMRIGQKQRGMFTYALIESLRSNGVYMPYSELTSRVQIRVRNQFGEHSPQNPQIEAPHPEDKFDLFLTGIPAQGQVPSVIAYDLNRYSGQGAGWIVNRGAIHGIKKGDNATPTIFEVLGENITATVKEVFPDFSTVSGMESYDKPEDQKRTFAAKIIRHGMEKTPIALGNDTDLTGLEILMQEYNKGRDRLFTISRENAASPFRIQIREQAFYLSGMHEHLPLFESSKGFTEGSAIQFLERLDHAAKWMQALELRNPDTSITDQEYKIELFQSAEPWNQENDTPVQLVNWQDPPTFEYQFRQGKWHEPVIQLKITNTGDRPLWVSLLYLGDDFSISNRFLPVEKLNPGHPVWAKEIVDDYSYISIPIRITPEQLDSGVRFIHEYMKLFIATDSFSTDSYYQEGLPREVVKSDRAGGRTRGSIKRNDWKCVEIPLRVLLWEKEG